MKTTLELIYSATAQISEASNRKRHTLFITVDDERTANHILEDMAYPFRIFAQDESEDWIRYNSMYLWSVTKQGNGKVSLRFESNTALESDKTVVSPTLVGYQGYHTFADCTRAVVIESCRPAEVWETIADFPKYQASNLGEIRNASTGRIMKWAINSANYMFVGLMRDGRVHSVAVHKLIAKTFVENPHNKKCVNHKDGNKLNCAASNLEWMTHAENNLHARVMGLWTGQIKNHNPLSHVRRSVVHTATGQIFDTIKSAAKTYGIAYHILRYQLSEAAANTSGFKFI